MGISQHVLKNVVVPENIPFKNLNVHLEDSELLTYSILNILNSEHSTQGLAPP